MIILKLINNQKGVTIAYILSAVVMLSILAAVLVHTNKGVLVDNDIQVGKYLANQSLMLRSLILNCPLQYPNGVNQCVLSSGPPIVRPHASFPCANDINNNDFPKKANIGELVCPGDTSNTLFISSNNYIVTNAMQQLGIQMWEYINDAKSVRLLLKSENYAWTSSRMAQIKDVLFQSLAGTTDNNDIVYVANDDPSFSSYIADPKYICIIIKKTADFPPCNNVFNN